MTQKRWIRGRYFEEFEIGDTVITQGRTITAADIVNFAGLSGDFNAIHTDAEFAKQGFGQRVAHGLLITSIASGLAVQTGFIDGTAIAFREMSTKFSLPVFIDDTIHVRLEVTEKKEQRRLGGGLISLKCRILNQDEKIVQKGNWHVLVQSKSVS